MLFKGNLLANQKNISDLFSRTYYRFLASTTEILSLTAY